MIHNLLKNIPIVLASSSPRRKEIFELIGLKALQVPANTKEEMLPVSPAKLVATHSLEKARAVKAMVDSDCLIVAADTIVYHNHVILGKPEDPMQAAEYLTLLSGDNHYVYTGITIYYKNSYYKRFTRSRVEFKTLTSREIEDYIMTKEPLDKAGAYGIQGYGSQFIKKISGCYFNVMGFPVSLFYNMLKEILK
jgi:nucleoside triphosphate pyrophosphatase